MKLFTIKDTLTETYLRSLNYQAFTHDINMASIFTNAKNAQKGIRQLSKDGDYNIDNEYYFTTDAKKSEKLDEEVTANNKSKYPNYGYIVQIKEQQVKRQNLEVTEIKVMEAYING